MRRVRIPLLLALLTAATPAVARIPTAQFEKIELRGLRLGMTISDAESILRTRRDLDEPGTAAAHDVACGALLANSAAAESQRAILRRLSFGDAAHNRYNLDFADTATGPITYRVGFDEWGVTRDWDAYLAVAQRRFGTADFLSTDREGAMVAIWCEESPLPCSRNDSRTGTLEIIWYPRYGVLENDKVVEAPAARMTLDGGARRDSYRAAAVTPDAGASQAACRKAPGRFPDQWVMQRHYADLVQNIEGLSPATRDPRQVPAAAFATLGIDRDRYFGEGMCFNSSDVLIDEPDCRGTTSLGFNWARQAGSDWLISLKHGGVVLRTSNHLLRRNRDGSYREVWKGPSLAPLSGWMARSLGSGGGI